MKVTRMNIETTNKPERTYQLDDGQIHVIRQHNASLPIAPLVYYYDDTAMEVLEQFIRHDFETSGMTVIFDEPDKKYDMNFNLLFNHYQHFTERIRGDMLSYEIGTCSKPSTIWLSIHKGQFPAPMIYYDFE